MKTSAQRRQLSTVDHWRFQLVDVYVWSQYDGANIEQWTIGYGWRQNQEAKQKGIDEKALFLHMVWTVSKAIVRPF